LSKEKAYKELALKLLKKKEIKPREGVKEDPAHPAIYPTGNLPKRMLGYPEKRLWDLVVKRFMAVFGETALRQSIRAILEVNGHNFFLEGRQTLKEGWRWFYRPYVKAKEVLLPPIKEGESVRLKRVIWNDKFVNPPPRYNPASLLKKMEEFGIGTKATRAGIIETLYSRKYITEERIVVTDLGFDIIETLSKYAPRVISVELTQELEKKLENIQSNNEKRENILLEAIEHLKLQLENFKEKEKQIGEVLSKAIKKARTQERIVGKCPVCGTGNLIILYSRKTKKRFIGCTNYFKGDCKTSFPLPQLGKAIPMGRDCGYCGWPMVQVQIRGRKARRLCFNPNCQLKAERRKHAEMQSLLQRNPG
jgi:DNA topoisomerase-1